MNGKWETFKKSKNKQKKQNHTKNLKENPKFEVTPHLSLADPWWRHQKETFSALLALCAGNSPVIGEFPAQSPVTRSFDVFFDLRLNKRLSKHSWGWWFEMTSRPLWRHGNAYYCPSSLDIEIWKLIEKPIQGGAWTWKRRLQTLAIWFLSQYDLRFIMGHLWPLARYVILFVNTTRQAWYPLITRWIMAHYMVNPGDISQTIRYS